MSANGRSCMPAPFLHAKAGMTMWSDRGPAQPVADDRAGDK
jgi:hypothetical protein